MTAHLDMDDHYINNLLDPSNPQDVATKNYVDGLQPIAYNGDEIPIISEKVCNGKTQKRNS